MKVPVFPPKNLILADFIFSTNMQEPTEQSLCWRIQEWKECNGGLLSRVQPHGSDHYSNKLPND